MEMNSFYLSRVLGRKVFTEDRMLVGKVKDLGIKNTIKSPRVEVIKVKTSNGIIYISSNNISINKEKGQYAIICHEIKKIVLKDIMFLSQHILDKQIIDVNGRKVVRVNDIRLANLGNGIFIVAVDIGTEGILRRIGIAKPITKMGLKISSKLILWKDVETIFSSNENIMLSKTYNKLSILHPSDLADIIEDFHGNTGIMIFSSLDNSKAADVLEQMEEDAQINLVNNLSTDKIADILEEMPADEVADILDGLSEHRAEELLSNMEKDSSNEVRELMEYEDNEVGSLMSTEYVSLKSDLTIEQAINILRKLKPEEDEMYCIYVVDNKNELIGTLSLRDIIISNSNIKLHSLMNKDFAYIYDKDDIRELIKTISKYNLLAVPIVNENKNLLGNVIINDVIYELLKTKRRIG
ncbi:magnesium transporter MgtE [Clostridium pasteurianum DSM 525 = ATCC 6013]|uniref:Magnesium transporter MgtE n=1 Tax=Clostridium pasteurianum DSM 525 = ATCC 6013 TaxID=1262449 RepID=A0A0H3J9Q2_CLOPA|nr:CBS domain-containing protein [Clostridium pasteurianum]AJA50107.1 magnesium transporter MgtE [Clostridium pasteurianum DSM 525 = ATCC 6013]AJA54095.1 magnesium transporter MgtE [Clostridium pasteurianum DSM 525 = ATCC 6013]AOZ77223.1 magnesium transporter MgtE [Clostridium pasteurianum DSM 525 = ATCC 6013]AOZ81019.1 magnesium transporter MgtE [Clostridium pasteurianum]ELP59193.1 divalent cation transporter [Clostridium pasteurianum DSM 525 = ATCC 6013]